MMNRKDCRSVRREIDESELGQRLSEAARSHVADCSACRGFQSERTSLRELVGSLEPVAAPGDFEMRLRARIASDRIPERRSGLQGFGRWSEMFRFATSTPGMASAALVVLLAISLVWIAQRTGGQRTLVGSLPPVKVTEGSKQLQGVTNDQSGSTNSDQINKPIEIAQAPQSQDHLGKRPRETSSAVAQSGARATDYGVSPAEIVRRGTPRAGEVSLSAPLNPMVVSMQDDQGATRRISLPPVSFGAQRLVDKRVPVSFSPNSRSW